MSRRAIHSAAAALAAAALVLAGAALPAHSAVRAEPDLGSAQAQARRLAAEVDALEIRAEQAVEAYNAVQSRLAAAVTASVSATRRLDAARQSGQGRRSAAERSVRAVYMAGGQAALYGTLLDGRDPADVLARASTVALVLRQQDASADRGEAQARELAQATSAMAGTAEQAAALEREAGEAAAAVRALLDARAAELAAADAQVRRLAEEARRQAEAEAAARAAALLGTDGRRRGAAGRMARGPALAAGPAAQALAAARSPAWAALRVGGDRPRLLRLLRPHRLGVPVRRGLAAAHLARAVARRDPDRPAGAATRRPAVLGDQPEGPADHPPRGAVRRGGLDARGPAVGPAAAGHAGLPRRLHRGGPTGAAGPRVRR